LSTGAGDVRRWSTFWVKWHADRPQSDWQVLYNAACYFALIRDRDNGFRFLTRALDEGGAEQLYGLIPTSAPGGSRPLLRKSWIDRDPDLASLRDDPRWDTLRDRTGHRLPYSPGAKRNAILQGSLGAVLAVAAVAAVLLIPWMWIGIAIVVLAAGWFVMVVVRYLRSETRLIRLVAPSSDDDRIRGAPGPDSGAHRDA
jgi:hypothetical protein